ncbi:unnamed protein product [Lepidochelys kempii]
MMEVINHCFSFVTGLPEAVHKDSKTSCCQGLCPEAQFSPNLGSVENTSEDKTVTLRDLEETGRHLLEFLVTGYIRTIRARILHFSFSQSPERYKYWDSVSIWPRPSNSLCLVPLPWSE